MSTATTIIHVQDRAPEAIERALEGLFARERRQRALRVEGTYEAVLERCVSPEVDATYRYLLLRPRATGWASLLELGLRAGGLDVELSLALDGATVITIFEYDEVVSGYRVIQRGAEVDRYLSDPTAFEGLVDGPDEPDSEPARLTPEEIEAVRGRPERFASLLPAGAPPDDFARVVLRPGWWDAHYPGAAASSDEDPVDEVDRARCIGLALELWAADEYPLAGELEDIPNAEAGPAIALDWA